MDSQQTPMETEICHNCKKEVPQQNYIMHVAHCARNMSTCPICQESVARSRLEEHHARRHKTSPCPQCQRPVTADCLQQHLSSECPVRLDSCQHCSLDLPHEELSEHEYHCGARTDKCEECGEIVMLKYQRLHLESNHGFLKLPDEPGPSPSWETSAWKSSQQKNSFEDMKPLKSSLDSCESASRDRGDREVPPRDVPRTFVPVYDASDDLRAKVKLARHDLNHIKHSVMAGEERVRQLTSRVQVPLPDLTATRRRPPPTFRTNLVPYEPHKSHQVNAKALEADSTAKPDFFTYLGTPASEPLKPLKPLQSLSLSSNSSNGSLKQTGVNKLATGSDSSSSSKSHSRGAVPRLHKKNKAPAPPPPTPPKSYSSDLPCEFCNKLISADSLILHQTGCKPNLTQLVIPPREEISEARLPSPEVQLPCEFCAELIPASELLKHQALCDV